MGVGLVERDDSIAFRRSYRDLSDGVVGTDEVGISSAGETGTVGHH